MVLNEGDLTQEQFDKELEKQREEEDRTFFHYFYFFSWMKDFYFLMSRTLVVVHPSGIQNFCLRQTFEHLFVLLEFFWALVIIKASTSSFLCSMNLEMTHS